MIMYAKEVDGKHRLSLVSPDLIEAVGAVRTYGSRKYHGDHNWRSVPSGYYLDALLRHLCAYMRDVKAVDAESGLPHLWHVACNVNFLVETLNRQADVYHYHDLSGGAEDEY